MARLTEKERLELIMQQKAVIREMCEALLPLDTAKVNRLRKLAVRLEKRILYG